MLYCKNFNVLDVFFGPSSTTLENGSVQSLKDAIQEMSGRVSVAKVKRLCGENIYGQIMSKPVTPNTHHISSLK